MPIKLPVVQNIHIAIYVHACTCNYLQYSKQPQVLHYCESVKEYIVLGTDSEAVSDLVHVAPDVITIDDCCTSSWCVQT